MITLKANHQVLTKNTEFSYTSINYASAVNSVVVTNSDVFASNDYVLLGEWGQESAEIIKINTVTAATHTIAFTTNTVFAHSESTRITIIKYNQVGFYQTVAATFDSNENPLVTYADIQADDYFTRYHDLSNSSGFGWYVFYNETLATTSSPSNAIPYADFDENSVKKIFENFDSLLNTKEISLVTGKDKLNWLNEAHARASNELNLVNQTYNAASEFSLSITAGTSEYSLPSDFGGLMSITDADGYQIPHITLRKERQADQLGFTLDAFYYIRGASIGITPDPGNDTTYFLYYTSKSTKLTSLYDNVSYPNNNFYFLVDWMMYRAGQKLKKSQGEIGLSKDNFEEGVKMMKITSINQTANRNRWGIVRNANV